jgi:hypothetical protein
MGIAVLLALGVAGDLHARPIVFARSTNLMLDYREGAMAEAQIYYAPEHWYSLGLGHTDLSSDQMEARHSVTYARVNVLAKRWNMEGAQANIFGWAGIGTAYVGGYTVSIDAPPSEHDHGGPPPAAETGIVPSLSAFARHVGGQIDFETQRFYTSFKTDLFDSSLYWHRADTLQVGFSPYRHDTNTLATWFIVSGRNYAGDMHEGTDLAFLLRLFRKRSWIEAGATTDGKIQAMAMFNF